MKKKLIITVICLGIASFIIFKLVSNKKRINKESEPAKVENVKIPVSVAIVSKEQQQVQLIKTGLITPFKEAKALSKNSGNISRLNFNLGDNVHKGQALAVVDTRSLELDFQKAESNASKFKRDLQIYTELLEGKASTQEKVNEITQNYNDALNQVQQLRTQISEAVIKAPTNGMISTKPIVEGMYVAAGAEITSIVDLSSLKIQVNLTENEVYQVSLGQKIKLTTDVYPGKSFEGIVSFISPQVNQAYNYLVEITADNDKRFPLRSGTFVNADFSRKTSQNVLLIPREALVETAKETSVYIAKDGKAILQDVKVGGQLGDKVYILQGLNVGDQVITSGQINLKDGSVINISK